MLISVHRCVVQANAAVGAAEDQVGKLQCKLATIESRRRADAATITALRTKLGELERQELGNAQEEEAVAVLHQQLAKAQQQLRQRNERLAATKKRSDVVTAQLVNTCPVFTHSLSSLRLTVLAASHHQP